MNKIEIGLIFWTFLASVWWIIALKLVTKAQAISHSPKSHSNFFLTLFKPLPAFDEGIKDGLPEALESFLNQLDENSELLLGLWAKDKFLWEPWLKKWAHLETWKFVKVVWREEPDCFPNPKIAWNKILSSYARGEYWLWSDADILAPPHFLRQVRSEFIQSGAKLLTHGYVIRKIHASANLLEALFVNVEFFPGIFVLNLFQKKNFGFGASLLFKAETIKGLWSQLGQHLAEDFMLGKSLNHSHLSQMVVETLSNETHWKNAIQHYLRWQKTICWVKPGGFAGQILLFPLLGWIGYCLVAPLPGILGLSITLVVEVFFAVTLCHKVGCIISWRYYWSVITWCVVRSIGWVICWLPWPVKWGKQWWWKKSGKSYEKQVGFGGMAEPSR